MDLIKEIEQVGKICRSKTVAVLILGGDRK